MRNRKEDRKFFIGKACENFGAGMVNWPLLAAPTSELEKIGFEANNVLQLQRHCSKSQNKHQSILLNKFFCNCINDYYFEGHAQLC